MKIGLVTDVHEEVRLLRAALERFDREPVDRVVVLGDLAETGDHLDETCGLLAAAGATGVWGNHDFGLCRHVAPEVAARYAPATIEYLASLAPRATVAGCHLCHIEPWLDPIRLEDLWHFDGLPRSPDRLLRIFSAATERVIFVGHHHRWMLATPRGPVAWDAATPVRLAEGTRWFVVVGALCDGQAAIYDTGTSALTPIAVT